MELKYFRKGCLFFISIINDENIIVFNGENDAYWYHHGWEWALGSLIKDYQGLWS